MHIFRSILKLYVWMLRIALPVVLIGMLVAPVLLDPPDEMTAAARATMADATIVPIGSGGSHQYTFLRLPEPLFVVVERASNGAISVEETRAGLWFWMIGFVLLAAATWWVWRRRRTGR